MLKTLTPRLPLPLMRHWPYRTPPVFDSPYLIDYNRLLFAALIHDEFYSSHRRISVGGQGDMPPIFEVEGAPCVLTTLLFRG